MPKNLQKVQKHIAKKRGVVEALHENSRDAKLLRRAGARNDKLARVASVMSKARQSYGTESVAGCPDVSVLTVLAWTVDRVAFFQEAIGEASGPLSDSEMMDLVTRYDNLGGPLTQVES